MAALDVKVFYYCLEHNSIHTTIKELDEVPIPKPHVYPFLNVGFGCKRLCKPCLKTRVCECRVAMIGGVCGDIDTTSTEVIVKCRANE